MPKTKKQIFTDLVNKCIFLEDATLKEIQTEIEGSGFEIISPKCESDSSPFFLSNGKLIFEFESVHGCGKMVKVEQRIKKFVDWLEENYSDSSTEHAALYVKDARRFAKLLNESADRVAKTEAD